MVFRALNMTERGSLTGLVRALDSMDQTQRRQYLNDSNNNIVTLQKGIAEETVKLEQALAKFKENRVEYVAYEVSSSPLFWVIGGVTLPFAAMLTATGSRLGKIYFVADAIVLASAAVAQTAGFKEMKLKEADVKKYQESLGTLQTLLSRESDIVALLKTRYSIQ